MDIHAYTQKHKAAIATSPFENSKALVKENKLQPNTNPVQKC